MVDYVVVVLHAATPTLPLPGKLVRHLLPSLQMFHNVAMELP